MSQPARRLSILVVDDDPLVLLGAVEMLEDLGHRVAQAKSGPEALKVMEGTTVDLVLSDQSMPMMTGAELAARIRLKHADLPIVLVTGYAVLPPDLPAGVSRLGKPFSHRDLVRVIADICGAIS